VGGERAIGPRIESFLLDNLTNHRPSFFHGLSALKKLPLIREIHFGLTALAKFLRQNGRILLLASTKEHEIRFLIKDGFEKTIFDHNFQSTQNGFFYLTKWIEPASSREVGIQAGQS